MMFPDGLARRIRFFGVFPAVVLLGAAAANGSDLNGFMRDKGKGDVAISWTHQNYDEFWMGTKKVATMAGGDVKTDAFAVWVDYGVTDRLTLMANLPYVKADGTDSFPTALTGAADTVKGWQDVSILGKYRFGSLSSGPVRNDFVGGFGLRTIASNYDVPGPVDIGDATADWLFRFVYQLTAGPFYFSQQVGYDLRGGVAPNQWPFYTETGYTTGPVTWSVLYSKVKAGGGTDIGGPGFLTFPGNKEEYERLGAKVFGRVTPHVGFSGMYFTTLSGRNTGDATGFSGGAVFSW